MRQLIKSITIKLALFSLAGLLIGQGSGYLAQKLMVENNIRERVRDALSKIVDNNKYVINVDVDLEISDEVEEQITVLAEREKQKSKNRRIQITFLNPPHHGKGRSATSYED